MVRVFVTGAGGYVGGALVARLAQGRGHDVIASARRWGPQQQPASAFARHVADLRDDRVDWVSALAGVDVVVHCAALVHGAGRGQPEAAFMQANAASVERLAAAAARAGVRRFVLVSSIAVHGRRSDAAIAAQSPLAPADAYARSKLAGERALNELCGRTGMTAVIIRPPMVYGPGAPGNFARLLTLLRRGAPLPLPRVANRRSFIGIDNLVDCLAHCITHADAFGAYVVADAEVPTTAQFVAAVAAAAGRPQRTLPVPAGAVSALARLLGRQASADSLICSLWVDPSDGRRLGWDPAHSLEAGLIAAIRQRD